MSLIIALGSNLNNRKQNLNDALKELKKSFVLIETSHIYESQAVDYENQPAFLNMVAEFQTPDQGPEEVLNLLLEIEKNLGRVRDIPKGPRTIDLDILFFDDQKIDKDQLTIPHPRMFDRSFVVRPLSELKCYNELKNKYSFGTAFEVESYLYKGD